MEDMLRYVSLLAALAVSPAQAADSVALTVTTAQVVAKELSTLVRGIGIIQPRREIKIYPEVSGGRIVDTAVEVGEVISMGQVIAKLDSRSLRNGLERATAAVEAAIQEEGAAEAAIDRARRLASNGAVSKESVETLEASASRSKSTLLDAQAQKRDAEMELAKSEVVATVAGTVMSVDQRQGEVAQAGAALVTIAVDGEFEAVALVPERWIAELAPGNVVAVSFEGGERTTGTVRLVDPSVDPETHMGKVYVSLPRRAGIKKGMFVRVSVETAVKQALWVPAKSVAWRTDGAKVFLFADGVVREIPVKAGEEADGLVPVDGGLVAGELVVVAGAGFLYDGDRVSVATGNGQ
jgi:RND family efflux transporter MFP subunit